MASVAATLGMAFIPGLGATPAGATTSSVTTITDNPAGTAPTLGVPVPEGSAKISPTYVARSSNGDIALAETNAGSVFVYLIPAGTTNEYHIQTAPNPTPAFGPLTPGDAYLVAGTGTAGLIADPGVQQFPGDPPTAAATTAPITPTSVAFDSNGNLLIAGAFNGASAIQVDAKTAGTFYDNTMTAGDLYTIADVGLTGAPLNAINMGDVAAVANGMSVDPTGNIVVGNGDGVDFVNEQPSGSLSIYGQSIPGLSSAVVAGSARGGTNCSMGGPASAPATSLFVQHSAPYVDSSDNVYFSDNAGGSGRGCVWVLPAQSGNIDGMSVTAGNVYKLAGNGDTSATGDGISGVTSNVAGTSSITVDSAGNVIFGVSGSASGTSPALRVLAESNCLSACGYGLSSTTAGDLYTAATGATPGPATLTGPTSVLSDGLGNLLVTDGTTTSNANLDEAAGGPTAVPVVTSVSPSEGLLAGGNSVTITSSVPNFTGATVVHFGELTATPTVVSASEITVTSPGPGSGTVDVTVTTPAGTSATSNADSFTYVPAPIVTGVSPSSGPAAGGTGVTIGGTNFTGATAVDFGTTAATGVIVNGAGTSITATSPVGSGTVNVTVMTPGGTSATSSADDFTYIPAPIVTGVSPPSGPAAGGTGVTIAGTNFSGATAVDFGTTAATGVIVNGAGTSITATSPVGSGTVNVTVMTPGGTSATSSADDFAYIPAPIVTGVSPNVGPLGGGTGVTITGSNFTGATAVDFGITAATGVTVNGTGTSITATSPSGSGTVNVTVMTPGGTSATSSADDFTYVPAPTVTGVSPNVGPLGGGTGVTITGSNFTGATAVKFGTTAATGVIVNGAGTSITATSPSGSGTVNVTVMTPGGTSATSSADDFTYVPEPIVTGVSPNGGTDAGGTSVTITGSNFTGATAVKFGTTAATGVIVNSATSITATSPATGTIGTVDVTVTTPGGTSATSSADHFSYGPQPPPAPSGATQSAGASSFSPTGTATASLPGNSISASFTGVGAVTVAKYGGNPTTGAVSGGTGVYYDVKVATGSTMQSLTITVCSLGTGGQSIDWWNGSAWVPFSNQTFDSSTGCVTATVNAGTSPSLGQLTGTPVAASSNSLSSGYWLVASDGGIFNYGGATFYGSTGSMTLNKPIVGMASTPDGKGYWLVASDGGIFSYGDATFYGSTGSMTLNKPIVGMASTPDGKGYWLVASDGGIFAFGDAAFDGSTGSMHLNKPVVGMAATRDGKGYWLVASDGGIFSYGDATFHGSTGSITLNKPVVGMTATKDGKGYWLVASDGGIFTYGDATFNGSTGSITLNKPVVGMAATADGQGYWLVASDGGIFNYGDATFAGSTGGMSLNKPVVGMAAQAGGS